MGKVSDAKGASGFRTFKGTKGLWSGLFLLAVFALIAQASQVDVMIGSRAYGLGGAYVAIADDPTAGYWNPAGLSYQKDPSFMESNWLFQDVANLNVNYISAVAPFQKAGVFSVGWLLTSVKLEQGWDAVNNAPANSSNANEGTISLSYGRQLCEGFSIFKQPSIGFTINRFDYTTSDYGGGGVGLDIGLLTQAPFGLSVGFMGRNIASEIKDQEVDPEFRLGFGYTKIFNGMHKITADADGSYKMNRDYSIYPSQGAANNLKAYYGMEYTLLYDKFEIAVRCGGNGMLYSALDAYDLACGAGVAFNGYSFQYAFKDGTNSAFSTGAEHRLSLVINLRDVIHRTRVIADKTAPVLKLKGDTVLTISTRDASFTDQGAAASDEVSGDLTKSITSNSQVNPNVPGTYYITYAISDEAGNTSTKMRTVNVVAPDTIAPVITLQGDSMVTLAVGEPYQESGAKAFDNVDKWLEKISVSGTIDTAKSGVYTLAYAAADKAGNIATKLRTVQVIPPLFKRFNVPSPQPLESIDTTFTKIKVEGWGPDLSSIINLKVMWKLDQQKLDTFDFHLNIMTGKGKKAHPATLGAKLTHTFGQKEPALTLKETGIHGFDGEYYARKSENGLILVRIDGNCAILCNP